MKVVVYAISKNEEKFVNRWYESMKEADEIYVLDTGSDDNTVKLLKEKGVNVNVCEINPWRFDEARNKSLDMVPMDTDICVCTDLDEVFVPGWRMELEKVWKKDTNRLRYIFNWKLEGNIALVTFYGEKIHSRHNFKWINPVHEVLSYSLGNENILVTDNIVLNHYPDINKSRGSYLSLLELSIKEDPLNDRNMHYLGREYMYYSRWEDCIKTLINHLKLPSATWKDERCASMRFIARSYINLGRYDEARIWLNKAIKEAPYLREAYIELGYLLYEEKDYLNAYYYLKKSFEIKDKSNSYINEEFAWNSFPYDLLSICAFNLEFYEEAFENVKKALELDKNNLRLQLNLEEMEKYVN